MILGILITILIGIGIFILGLALIIFIWGLSLIRNVIPDPEVTTTHHNGEWGYYFHDPYGNMISHGDFRTEKGAARAGRRHRERAARDLQEALGL